MVSLDSTIKVYVPASTSLSAAEMAFLTCFFSGLLSNMKLNPSKCLSMNVTFSRNPPLPNVLCIDNMQLPNVSSVKILGVTIQSNLKWDAHILDIIKRCNRKLYMFRSIKQHGLSLEDLKTVYIGYIRPVLEYCAPVFNSGITNSQVKSLERIQKRVLKMMLGKKYVSYENACYLLNLPTLEARRRKLSEDFSKTLINHPACRNWLPPRRTIQRSLRHYLPYEQFHCKTQRYRNSPMPYFVDILNGRR